MRATPPHPQRVFMQQRHESPAHGALARSAAHHWSRHRFQTTGVLTGGDPHQHLFDHTAIQRIAVGERLKGRQRDVGAIAAGPWPANRHLPATQDDFARHRAGARRLARDLMLVPRTADRRSVFLEHRREHLPAGGDGELQQRRARIDEQIDERQLALGLGITLVGLIDCARRSLPGGSFLAGLRPGLVTTRVSRAVRSRRSHISTAVGTSPPIPNSMFPSLTRTMRQLHTDSPSGIRVTRGHRALGRRTV